MGIGPFRKLAAVAYVVISALLLLAVDSRAYASILTSIGVAVTENFDSLANAGTSSSLPADWGFAESGGNSNATYTAGTGSSNAADTFSFGVAGSNERAFGTLLSSTLNSTIGAVFTNGTGATITELDIAYSGEQWRRGEIRVTGPIDNRDRLNFQFSTTATGLITGTYLDVDALDLISSLGSIASGSLLSSTALSGTISGLSIPIGATFWIRWTDFNAIGNDDGLAIDNFSLTPHGIVPPPVDPMPEASTILIWAMTCGAVLAGRKKWECAL